MPTPEYLDKNGLTYYDAKIAAIVPVSAGLTGNALQLKNAAGAIVIQQTLPAQTPKSSTTPLVDGTATIGSTNTYADGAHVHPTDTSRQAALNRTVGGNDNATGTVTDTGGALSVPIPVTAVAPAASSTQTTAATRTLRAQLKILIDNIAHLFANKFDKPTGSTSQYLNGAGTATAIPAFLTDVVAGSGISIAKTDPKNPIISAVLDLPDKFKSTQDGTGAINSSSSGWLRSALTAITPGATFGTGDTVIFANGYQGLVTALSGTTSYTVTIILVPASGTAWGSITGGLVDQADLWDALGQNTFNGYSTAVAATAEKIVVSSDTSGSPLPSPSLGMVLTVLFSAANTAENPTLTVNGVNLSIKEVRGSGGYSSVRKRFAANTPYTFVCAQLATNQPTSLYWVLLTTPPTSIPTYSSSSGATMAAKACVPVGTTMPIAQNRPEGGAIFCVRLGIANTSDTVSFSLGAIAHDVMYLSSTTGMGSLMGTALKDYLFLSNGDSTVYLLNPDPETATAITNAQIDTIWAANWS
jgi:hypothetical protein